VKITELSQQIFEKINPKGFTFKNLSRQKFPAVWYVGDYNIDWITYTDSYTSCYTIKII